MPVGSTVASNASPLIYLAKIGRLNLLRQLFGTVIVPPRVWEEVGKGPRDSQDFAAISEAKREGWLRVGKVKSRDTEVLAEEFGIDRGEAESIILARERDLALLADDRAASLTARSYEVNTIGTLAILVLARRKGLLTQNEFRISLDKLVDSGFWMTVDLY